MNPETLQLIMAIEGQIAAPEAELLYECARAATVCIVEIGSFRGRSTVALALGSKAGHNVPVYAIDPHEQAGDGEYPYGPADREAFMRNVVEAGVADVVRMVNLTSEEAHLIPRFQKADLLFIDGDHSDDEVDFDAFMWMRQRKNCMVLFHDKHAESVQNAVRDVLKKYDQYSRIEDVEGIIQLIRGDK